MMVNRRIQSARVLVVATLLSGLWSVRPVLAESGPASDGPPNVLLFCIDDLRPELNCYGVDYIHSPNIDRLARTGRRFMRHYVQAPTCGASRFTLLTGRYGGASNNALFQRARRMQSDRESVPPSMPAWFRQYGYRTVSVGKVSHHPGGRGGPDWNDEDQLEMPESWDRHLMRVGPWQHPRGAMHGLAHGEIRTNAGEMDVLQAEPGDDTIYPDGLTFEAASEQLRQLTQDDSQPFFLAVGFLRPHLPFGAPKKYLDLYADTELPPITHPERPQGRSTWHGSGEFMKYNRWGKDPNSDAEFADEVRKHYAACVSYSDALVGKLLDQLEASGQLDDTIVVLWGDHGWHLGEHAIWGKHALFEESLLAPLIISHADLPEPDVASGAIVETLDIFPTLCELAELPRPDFVEGRSLKPILDDPLVEGRPAIAYTGRARTIRTSTHRLVLHNDGYQELYDHRTPAAETENVAERSPDLVQQLTEQLDARLPQR